MTRVGILGSGIMGSGIAQVAAVHGCNVELLDVGPEVVRRAIDEIGKRLDRLVEKKQLTGSEREQVRARLHAAESADSLAGCDVVLEAVSEDLAVKTKLLGRIAAQAAPNTIFASNTSSLSITRIGEAIGMGRRMVGMHFFNPAWLMPLVEIIAGAQTDSAVVEQTAALARSWGKTVVQAKDTPGFIVNRVARGFYLESLRMLEEAVAGIDEIDRTMKQLGGFRLGPFELMDLVGIDVNYSVSSSVWEQLGRPARLLPHPIQARLRDQGKLGRKTGQGFYDYSKDPPAPAVAVQRRPLEEPQAVRQAAAAFVQGATGRSATDVESYVFARVLATIMNEAAMLLDEGVASRADIDTAMRLGTNYPRGPLEWAQNIDCARVAKMLEELNAHAPDGRFAPARSLTQP